MEKITDFLSPISGVIMDISQVPDEIFAERVMGDGFAVDIKGPDVVAPIDGVIRSVFPGGHAICLEGDNGIQVLIHVGLETFNIDGLIDVYCQKNQHVKQGDLLVKAKWKKIRKKAKSPIAPIVFLNKETVHLLKENVDVCAGENKIVEISMSA